MEHESHSLLVEDNLNDHTLIRQVLQRELADLQVEEINGGPELDKALMRQSQSLQEVEPLPHPL